MTDNYNIYVIRHERRNRHCDIGSSLTPEGIYNSYSRITGLLKDEKIEKIYSSPFLRTVQTIFQVAKDKNIKINLEDGLYEMMGYECTYYFDFPKKLKLFSKHKNTNLFYYDFELFKKFNDTFYKDIKESLQDLQLFIDSISKTVDILYEYKSDIPIKSIDYDYHVKLSGILFMHSDFFYTKYSSSVYAKMCSILDKATEIVKLLEMIKYGDIKSYAKMCSTLDDKQTEIKELVKMIKQGKEITIDTLIHIINKYIHNIFVIYSEFKLHELINFSYKSLFDINEYYKDSEYDVENKEVVKTRVTNFISAAEEKDPDFFKNTVLVSHEEIVENLVKELARRYTKPIELGMGESKLESESEIEEKLSKLKFEMGCVYKISVTKNIVRVELL